MNSDDLLRVLSEQLQDPDPELRIVALDRLSDLGLPGVTARIAPLLEDSDERVCVEAMVCLRDLRDPAAVPHLIAIAESARTDSICEYAITSLDGFYRSDIRDCLLRLLDKPLSNVSAMKVAIQMWRYPDDEVVHALQDLALEDDDRNVRSHSADSLAFIFRLRNYPSDWEPFWNEIAQDEEYGVSRFGEEALAMLRSTHP